jgi:hypothetical protein
MSEPVIMESPELKISIEMAAKGEKRPSITVSPKSDKNTPVEEILKRADQLMAGAQQILKERFDAEIK